MGGLLGALIPAFLGGISQIGSKKGIGGTGVGGMGGGGGKLGDVSRTGAFGGLGMTYGIIRNIESGDQHAFGDVGEGYSEGGLKGATGEAVNIITGNVGQSEGISITMPSVKTLAPAGPSESELVAIKQAEETKRIKSAADKRSATLEAGIKADTATAVASKRRSLVGMSSTIKTSAYGLKTRAPTEKKTLLGQGGLA